MKLSWRRALRTPKGYTMLQTGHEILKACQYGGVRITFSADDQFINAAIMMRDERPYPTLRGSRALDARPSTQPQITYRK